MSVRGRQETVRVPANPLLVTARKALVGHCEEGASYLNKMPT